ncbi:GT2 family glycosyltransferase [Prauserella shujinwangii]|uniref:GT2 family glycosyltransferase n=1 Tax=Prauserella shujinwangii TaxID=1453103 RepID=A0A2T0LVR1_9PSEU|nr:glycosyltransferase [Prauserella shujinwangii]PRX47914.1 GT2 family glycosyltransferase [Prauserella shujinwangii]
MTIVDIMLPYYGPVDLMRETVRSVLAQDDPHWRLTVVDDGYPDASIPGWFAALGEPRVRYVRNERNLGANRNYQKCLGLIEHELAVIMGADDVMLPNYVGTVREAYRAHPDVAMLQPGVRIIDERGRHTCGLVDNAKRRLYAPKVLGTRTMSGEEAAVSLLRGNWLYFPSLCWRSAAIKEIGFREGLDVVQDLGLVLDLIYRGEKLLVDSTVCFHYRRHSASDSSWRALAGTRFVEERRFFLDTAKRAAELGWSRAARVARTHLSSRLNALTLLPSAIRAHHRTGVSNLTKHVLGVGD